MIFGTKDLSIQFAGIKTPNPFWLASAPPTNTGEQISRAFEMGWGGAVWKTLGTPIINVSSRLGGINHRGRKLAGLNNIELITDRDLDTNFKEIAEVKARFPDHTVVVSLMVETPEQWTEMIDRSVDAKADALELNFGCPHGMCERGMGSAVGQEPKVLTEITKWVKERSPLPVIAKLTPNITDICDPGLAAVEAKADAVSLINTVKSIVGVDLDNFAPLPSVDKRGTSGGFCGPSVKPIALHMVWQLARHPQFTIPIVGIGGITTWRDAAEFILLGASCCQVCTSVMNYGYRIIDPLAEGLADFMEEKGFESLSSMVGKAIPQTSDWGDLNLNYQVRAKIDEEKCIGCQLCFPACRDGGHHAIRIPPNGSFELRERIPTVDSEKCVGCNLCSLICPVECISMEQMSTDRPPQSWNEYSQTGKRL